MAPRGAPRAGLLAGGAVLLCLVAAARGAYRGRRQTYWFNEVTKVTQWEEPPKHEFIDGEPPPGRRAAPRHARPGRARPPPPPPTPPPASSLLPSLAPHPLAAPAPRACLRHPPLPLSPSRSGR